MIKYNLICSQDHEFEIWFKSIADFERQQKRSYISCPFCDDKKISRAIMAPAIRKKSNPKARSTEPLNAQKITHMMQKMHTHVKENFDYVGDKFADEARAIYYGDREDRDIYGETTIQEAKDLIDEGIPVAPLAGVPEQSKN